MQTRPSCLFLFGHIRAGRYPRAGAEWPQPGSRSAWCTAQREVLAELVRRALVLQMKKRSISFLLVVALSPALVESYWQRKGRWFRAHVGTGPSARPIRHSEPAVSCATANSAVWKTGVKQPRRSDGHDHPVKRHNPELHVLAYLSRVPREERSPAKKPGEESKGGAIVATIFLAAKHKLGLPH